MTADLRESLLAAQAEARRRVAEFDAVLRDLTEARGDADSDDEHDPEGSTVAWDRAVNAATAVAARDHLADVEAALARVEAGWDGRCATCLRPIPAERLAARPQTDRCVSCADRPT
ncbi:TraR/DksA family transcriptional regulator [Mobilicoccus caccae]|uniref:DnaK suppressor protein n=1 Tax=Mobilicoccus caccae TaxID=1859295 RepID=A0ABQ6IRZ4_9MICO|nr:TraR/DksA C4-type zinc finger protein [Mobilicoccus caccae]GMA40234.1 DnaK suppressor protein [Mobilicoccus caccae]